MTFVLVTYGIEFSNLYRVEWDKGKDKLALRISFRDKPTLV